ncbi:MAG: flagellar protein FlgN [Candidatus Scalindua rubra]|uniref:FlgN protein n=1 Tax=Candidatus Scalindua brodae TaxID=237368 RepID=A0A0B0EFQ9_9BACT|nr:MAG: FlgN protein [Candidatus Scalindua brodae]MBZ0107206.1 flagellar protein FlgN [Candidatus Scalindua rubra]TWU31644.1 FlgN protein [Candidatus Brocadiaceae bacterium S225]
MKNLYTTNREEILAYLIRKQKYYEKILELTEQQDEAIQSNNTKKLSLITTEKENYIKEIKRLDKLNIKIHEELKTNNKSHIPDKRIYSLLNQLHSIIIKIRNCDLDSISQLDSSVRNTKSRLSMLNKRMRAQQSMRLQAVHSPRYVDVFQ